MSPFQFHQRKKEMLPWHLFLISFLFPGIFLFHQMTQTSPSPRSYHGPAGGRFHGGLLLVATFRRSCHPDLYTGRWPWNSRKCGICGGSCRGTFQLLCFIAFLSRWRLFWHIKTGNSEEWKPSCHVTGFNNGDIPRGGFNCMTTCGICFALRNLVVCQYFVTLWHIECMHIDPNAMEQTDE